MSKAQVKLEKRGKIGKLNYTFINGRLTSLSWRNRKRYARITPFQIAIWIAATVLILTVLLNP